MMFTQFGVGFLVLGFSVCTIVGQDGFLYEQDLEDKSKLPEDGRLPLENHESCDENELFYPADKSGDWICDCKPGHVYTPKWNKCFPVYEKGPCRNNQFLFLRRGATIPRCKLNSCATTNKIIFKGQCRKMGEPCDSQNHYKVYGVNETTLQFECLQVPMMFMTDRKCVRGTKRYANKLCITKTT